jgi:hypothetical protein
VPPSGLDGASAQMIVGQLRDGLRMLFLSGRHVVLIDLLNGLGIARACSILSGNVRFTRLLGSFFAILIVDGRGEWR